MTDDAPLSMESAVTSMLFDESKGPDAPAPAAAAGANAATDGADAADDEQSGDAAAAATTDGQDGADGDTGTQDTPADQGETTDGPADQGDNALPPIEPPSSWKAEEKAEWDALPRKAQEAISRREQDNTRELRNLQNSQAEQRKAAEAEVTRLKGLASQVEAIAHRDVQDLAREFPEIKTEADVVALATSDPGRYALFQAKLMALNATNQARANALAEVAKADETKNAEFLTQAKTALLEAFPAWKEPDVARREVTAIQDYAIKMGATEAAARGNLDPVLYKLAEKAMLYDKAQADKAKAVNRTPPRVVTPGAKGDPKVAAKEEARRSQWATYEQTGDLRDAAKLLFA